MWQTGRLWVTWLTTLPLQRNGTVWLGPSCKQALVLFHPALSCPVLSHTRGPGTVWQIFSLPRSKLPGKVISSNGFPDYSSMGTWVPWACLVQRQKIVGSQAAPEIYIFDLLRSDSCARELQLNNSEMFIALIHDSTHLNKNRQSMGYNTK